MKITKYIILTLLTGMFFMSSCKKEDENGNEPKTMKVRMTDSPGDYERLDVEIASVEVYNDNKGWIEIQNESQVVTVTDLTNGSEVEIVSKTEVKKGTYTKLKLNFGSENKLWVNSEASLGDMVTTEFSLAFTSAIPSRSVEITINEEVNGRTGSNLLIDFDVVNSISGNANAGFILDPRITLIQDEETGAKGKVEGSQNVAVSAEGNGQTYTSYTDDNGNFMLRGMASGTYTFSFMPTEDEFSTTTTYESVVVADGEIKNMGTITLQ